MAIVDPSELLGVLRGYNPWWRGDREDVPQFRRMAYEKCRGYLAHPTLRRAVLLCGPRRVGKTTILQQLANELALGGQSTRRPESVFYLSLDNPFVKLATLPELLRLYHSTVYPEREPAVLLLDEIQYSRDWADHLKQLVDHHPEYRVIATGSASLIQEEGTLDRGVGRWIRVSIPTLSFYEFVHIQGEKEADVPSTLGPRDLFGKSSAQLADLAVRCRPLLPNFQRYLLVGGFPETARLEVGLAQRLLREDVVERVLKRDMTALFGVRNVDDLERLFLYVCTHSGGILEVQTVATALGVSHTTVSNYLTILERTGLIYRLPPIHAGGKKTLKARYKVYLADAALRNAVLLRGEEVLQNRDELGGIVETAVLRHLHAYHYPENPEIGYWKDSAAKKEVDIVIRGPSYNIAVEVKYESPAPLSSKEGICAYCSQETVTQAYWVTRADGDFSLESCGRPPTPILRIPAHIFTYLLGQAERLPSG